MNILPNGVAVCGTTHHAEWCAAEGLVHDPFMAKIVRENISPGDLFVNVGAHIGTLAKVAVDAGAKVLCFEPNREAIQCLRHNLANSSCGIFQAAIGAATGRAKFNRLDNAGASFLSAGNDTVVLPLDAFALPKVTMILMDCEGFELNVLRGAEQTIKQFHPKLLIEINEGALQKQGVKRTDIWDWLHEHGYENRKMQDDASYTSPQFDILCTWKSPNKLVFTDSQATTETIVLTSPGQTPWENREQSTDEIRTIAERLKQFMGNSVYTRRVRDVLHETGVIQLPYRFKKRKGKWKRRKRVSARISHLAT